MNHHEVLDKFHACLLEFVREGRRTNELGTIKSTRPYHAAKHGKQRFPPLHWNVVRIWTEVVRGYENSWPSIPPTETNIRAKDRRTIRVQMAILSIEVGSS